ncbi:hypothetical protein [Piscinibacterium candidicorallinum]|uniref:Uncharacterized protein n=1 Tax=Piscinibacterium candidicorallinum TaxID=1793872 RepID=A0ABV7H991_9BURK
MSTKDDANVLHAWAVSQGLFPTSVLAPAAQECDIAQRMPDVSESGRAVLRAKGIHQIVINEAQQRIYVLTKRARPSKKQLALLPKEVGDSSIEYLQGASGEIGGTPPTARGKPFYVVRVSDVDRYACGSSVSLGNALDAGTMGALVRNVDGDLFGLSNNHVTGGCNYAASQMPVMAPGVLDVTPLGFDPRTLGYHEISLPLVAGLPGTANVADNLDAALFKIRDEATVSSMQGDIYDTPTEVRALTDDMAVEKVGRTTGHTKGIVVGIAHEPVGIHYSTQGVGYSFVGQVYFDPVWIVEGKGGAFSDNGDSGSLITSVVDGKRVAVGLLIGGMKGQQGRDFTFIVPIASVLSRFNVTLVGGLNV